MSHFVDKLAAITQQDVAIVTSSGTGIKLFG